MIRLCTAVIESKWNASQGPLCVKGRASHCLKPCEWSAPLRAVIVRKVSWDSALAEKCCVGTSTVGVWAWAFLYSWKQIGRGKEHFFLWTHSALLAGSSLQLHCWPPVTAALNSWISCCMARLPVIQDSYVECKLGLSRALSMPGSGMKKKKMLKLAKRWFFLAHCKYYIWFSRHAHVCGWEHVCSSKRQRYFISAVVPDPQKAIEQLTVRRE